MTPEGFARLREELMSLMRKERPDVVKVVSWAAANGDRSENADYHYGKKRLREIDRRIRFLSKRLERSEVVDPAKRPKTDPRYAVVQTSMVPCLTAVADALRAGRPAETSAGDNLRTMRLVFAAYESAASGQTVPV